MNTPRWIRSIVIEIDSVELKTLKLQRPLRKPACTHGIFPLKASLEKDIAQPWGQDLSVQQRSGQVSCFTGIF